MNSSAFHSASNYTSRESIDILNHFDSALGQPVPAGFSQSDLAAFDLRLEPVSRREEEETLISMVDFLLKPGVPSGPKYLPNWEKGWAENRRLYELQRHLSSLIPAYIHKNKIFRFGGQFFTSPNPLFEAHLARVILGHYVQKYLSNATTIVEVGSGSCHYAYWLADRYPEKLVFALDWSEEANRIARLVSEDLANFRGFQFDMFSPRPHNFGPSSNALVTVGALEHIGTNFSPLLDWIQSSNFDVIVHLEPILELYDEHNLVDFLSVQYLLKRNWLRGYLPRLEHLEELGEIEILEKRRIFGSTFHETYTALVWRTI